MTTKLITGALIVLACFVGWTIFQYWGKVSDEQKMSQDEYERLHAAPVAFEPSSLPGMPDKMRGKLEETLAHAQQNGATGIREWLKVYRKFVQDPRLGWIELDYVVRVARENPAEAKKIFADVQERTPPTSPIYPRIKQLAKTYE